MPEPPHMAPFNVKEQQLYKRVPSLCFLTLYCHDEEEWMFNPFLGETVESTMTLDAALVCL